MFPLILGLKILYCSTQDVILMMLLRYPQSIFVPDIQLDRLDASTPRVGAIHHPLLLYDANSASTGHHHSSVMVFKSRVPRHPPSIPPNSIPHLSSSGRAKSRDWAPFRLRPDGFGSSSSHQYFDTSSTSVSTQVSTFPLVLSNYHFKNQKKDKNAKKI